MLVALDPVQSLLAALMCLLIGVAVNRKVPFLSKYNIPDPVTGGLLYALLMIIVGPLGNVEISLNATIKPTLLLMFFAGVGLGADLRLLKQGGMALVMLMLVLLPFVVLQNIVGLAVAQLIDLHPLYGLVSGSITLIGGHGTGAAYAERFAETHNLQAVMELSMTSATVGLILGGIVAGPVAQHLITRHKLRSNAREEGAAQRNSRHDPVTGIGMVGSLAGILFAVIVGQWLSAQLEDLPLTIPSFLWCMIVGVAVRNLAPFVHLHFDDRASEMVGGVCLALFLVMTMMTLDLIDVARTAGPLLLILTAQVIVVVIYTVFVCFRFMGKDYEAATTSAAFIGFNLGSTATAIANMQAIRGRYGPAPKSFLIVPLAGAFFVDLMNAALLTGFLSLPFIRG